MNKTLSLLFILCLVFLQMQARNKQRTPNLYDNSHQLIAAAYDHTLEIKGGKLFAWGRNADGELGMGSTTPVRMLTPLQIGADSNWVTVAAFGSSSSGIKSDGTLWVWGNNSGLGGTTMNYTVPTQVGNDKDWIFVAAVLGGGMAIKANGTLWAWGNNNYGNLGLGHNTKQTILTQVGSDKDWRYVSGGQGHTLALKTNGTLWACGRNMYGELGIGNTTDQSTLTQVGTEKNWSFIAAGGVHSVGIKGDGSMWAWGDDSYGQLGIGRIIHGPVPYRVGTSNNWVNVSAGIFATVGVQSDGSVWEWGYIHYYTMGLHPIIEEPTRVGTSNDWIKTALSTDHVIGIQANGSIWAWGDNSNGQIGNGNFDNQRVPIPIHAIVDKIVSVATGSGHTLLLRSGGRLWVWGNNNKGQLGIDDNRPQLYPVITNITNCIAVGAGKEHSMALKVDGTLWAWGDNTYGQLGNGSNIQENKAVRIGGATDRWTKISLGDNHTLAIKGDGTLWAWGDNSQGQLGLGNNMSQNEPTKVGTANNWIQIFAGADYSLALKSDGTLWAWGNNTYGQLGNGSNTPSLSPIQVGSGNTWINASAGNGHVVAIQSDGTLWAWGNNIHGQLGVGSNTSQNAPVQIPGSDNWIGVSTGRNHSMAFKADGTLWAWGRNTFGQLGTDNNASYNIPIQVTAQKDIVELMQGCSNDHSAIIKADRTRLCLSGYNAWGQLGDGGRPDQNTFSCLDFCRQTTPGISISSTTGNANCAGTNITFTATAINAGTSQSYTWKKNGIVVGDNSNIYNAGTTIKNKDTITCILNSSDPCTAPFTYANVLVMTVYPIDTPKINITMTPAGNLCLGNSVSFTAHTSNGGVTPVYEWRKNGIVVGTNSNIYNAGTSYISGDSITCTLKSSLTCITAANVVSNKIVLKVNPPVQPAIIIKSNLQNDAVCRNGKTKAVITAIATNAGAHPGFFWRLNGKYLFIDTAVYVTDTLVKGDTISCILLSDTACAVNTFITSNTITITDTPFVIPSIIISSSSLSDTICKGENVIFTALTTYPGDTPIYLWTKNSISVGTNSSTYQTTEINDQDTIHCTLISNEQCTSVTTVVSNKKIIKVYPLPIPVITRKDNTLNTGTYTSYQWYRHDNGNRIPLSQSSTQTIDQNGLYSVVVTDINGCKGESDIDTIMDYTHVGNISTETIKVNIYPNPAQNLVYINASIPVYAKLYSIDGKLIMDTPDAYKIDLGNFSNALYLLKIYSRDGMLLKTEKLVKNTQ